MTAKIYDTRDYRRTRLAFYAIQYATIYVKKGVLVAGEWARNNIPPALMEKVKPYVKDELRKRGVKV